MTLPTTSPWLDALIFMVAAGAIWWAGTRTEQLSDTIAKRLGLAQSFTGLVLLATTTSLPELATTVTAVAILDNPTLAVHNLLGGVALQTAIIAMADARKPRTGALTFFAPSFILLVQGVGLVMLLQLVVAGIVVRGVPSVASVSIWPVLIAGVYAAVLYLTYQQQGQPRWTPSAPDDIPAELRSEQQTPGSADGREAGGKRSTLALWSAFAGLGAIVLGAGFFAAESAEALAEHTGLGDAFMGATLLALATSLPELSTTLAASRGDRYSVVISNIFGSNAFDVSLLLIAELLYRKGSIFAALEPSVAFVPAVGAFMTCLYLWGLMERDNRTVVRVGWDSALAALTYAGAMVVLYFTA